jgi:poly(A) polymerase Pap1
MASKVTIKTYKSLKALLKMVSKFKDMENVKYTIQAKNNIFTINYVFLTKLQLLGYEFNQKIKIGDIVTYKPLFGYTHKQLREKQFVTDINVHHISINNKIVPIKFNTMNIKKNNDFVFRQIEIPILPKPIDISEDQFIRFLDDNKIKFQRDQALSGSQYWTINKQRFRKSDHYNPNNSNSDKIEVSFYLTILQKIYSN